MVLLINKTHWEGNTVSYDIHHNSINEVIDGYLLFTSKNGKAIVDIGLYGDSWGRGVHHYLSDIMIVLKSIEPQLFDNMLKVSIEKFSDKEVCDL